MKISLEIPQRPSLVAHTAVAMRKAIKGNVWDGTMPGGRKLCKIFQVSRPTIESALHLLAKEGLLEIRQAKRCRIIYRGPRSSRPKHRVCLVTHEQLSHMPLFSTRIFGELRTHLIKFGFDADTITLPRRMTLGRRREFRTFLRENRVLCCVLISLTDDWQRWFCAQPVPALLLGSHSSGIRLPSFDVNYRAVGRHAAGVFLSRGHREIALVVPDLGLAGELANEEGFLEGVRESSYGKARARIVRHRGTSQNIASRLDRLFDGPNPPTGLLVARPEYTLIVLIYLLNRGLKVPDSVSLIARETDYYVEGVLPQIAKYDFNENAYARRAFRLVIRMANHGYLPASPSLIFPRFIEGNTVRSLA